MQSIVVKHTTPLLAIEGRTLLSCIPTVCNSRPITMNREDLKTACASRCWISPTVVVIAKRDSTPTCHAVEYATTLLASRQDQPIPE